MDYKIIWSPTSLKDLKNIVTYIAQNNPERSSKIGSKIIEIVEFIAVFPFKGRVVPEIELDEVREVIHNSYRIIYRIQYKKKVIEIVRIWHAARGKPKI